MTIIPGNFKWNGKLKKRTSTDFVIVHHSDSNKASVADIHSWHQENGWLGMGYNYLIRKDGTTWEGRPEWATDSDAFGYNNNSLSICLEGNFLIEKIGYDQRESLINLLVDIKKKYPNIKMMRHLDVNDTSCPGEIGWSGILKEVDETINELKEKKEIEEYVLLSEYNILKKIVEKNERELGYLKNAMNKRLNRK